MVDVTTSLDQITRRSGYGQIGQAAGNALYGINHRGYGNPIPQNKDHHGLTFFTRPRLNLSYDNLAVDRVLMTLASKNNPVSYQTAIRVMLDPIGAGVAESISSLAVNDSTDMITSPLIDNHLPFMALLTNNLVSLSGWPDPSLDTWTSHEGIQKEVWSIADGIHKMYGVYSLTATFQNVQGDPITLLFNSWLRYISNVNEGIMLPYPDAIVENEIDYQTRIYRLVLDSSRRFVTKIGVANAAFPIADSLGSAFNYTSDQPYISDNQQIQVPFQCVGIEYLDPISIKEFNTIVKIFNNNMINPTSNRYVKLSRNQLQYFNYYGYPQINENTLELQWWVDAADYAAIASVVLPTA